MTTRALAAGLVSVAGVYLVGSQLAWVFSELIALLRVGHLSADIDATIRGVLWISRSLAGLAGIGVGLSLVYWRNGIALRCLPETGNSTDIAATAAPLAFCVAGVFVLASGVVGVIGRIPIFFDPRFPSGHMVTKPALEILFGLVLVILSRPIDAMLGRGPAT